MLHDVYDSKDPFDDFYTTVQYMDVVWILFGFNS